MLLLSPFGFSPTGEAFNLTMEDVATTTAIALQADKLLFVTEIPGVHEDPDDPESPIDTELALADAEKLLASLPPPLVPTDVALLLAPLRAACRGGVERSHILPFAIEGALLMEVFTHDGIGTMVVDEKLESLRQATADDIGGVLQLIEPFERDGTLVKRGRTEIERDIGNYTVIEHDGVIFGCAALYPYPEGKTGEMAALTVSAAGPGPGRRRADIEAGRAAGPRARPGEHLRADDADHALVLQARFRSRSTPTGSRRRASASTTGTGARRYSSRNSAERSIGRKLAARPRRRARMARTVQCVYLKREAEGLDFAPYPASSASASTPRQQGSVGGLDEAPDDAGQRESPESGRPAGAPIPGAPDGEFLLRQRRRPSDRIRAADHVNLS